MSTMTRTSLVQFFIPDIVATRLGVADLASGFRRSTTPSSRFTYRFTYRVGRAGSVYGCRIKASQGMATFLLEQLSVLVDKAEAEGDAAMLVGCALAVEAMEEQRCS